jgi:hypothetical protein
MDAVRYSCDPRVLPEPLLPARPRWRDLHDEAWRLLFGNIEYNLPPRWQPQFACMPGQDTIWQWDSCFLAILGRYARRVMPATNNLDNLYRLQRADGFLGMAYKIATGLPAFGDRINPPLFAWAEREVFRHTADRERLRRVLPVLREYFDWIEANRRRNNGLYWFEDSGSSGMDNSPRSGYPSPDLKGSDVSHVDLAAQQALSALCIAEAARELGDGALAARMEAEHARIAEVVNRHHWCAPKRCYYDVFMRGDPLARCNFVNHRTAASFWPMLAGIASEEQAECLAQLLHDPSAFGTPLLVPSLSRDDPNYDPEGGYWLGGVWAPMTYMVVRGLEERGLFKEAYRVACNHLDGMTEAYASCSPHTIWEAYAPERPQPATNGEGGLVRPRFVGWSGLGPIALLYETVLGIDIDAAHGALRWSIRSTEEHGVKRLPYGDGTVSLHVRSRKSEADPLRIAVETDQAILLDVSAFGRRGRLQRSLEAGRHEVVF